MFTVDNYMVAWSRKDGKIKVGPWPDPNWPDTGWVEKEFPHEVVYTAGACDKRLPKDRVLLLFLNLHVAIIRDKIDPFAAHKEFLQIKEYREHLSTDTPGATISIYDELSRCNDCNEIEIVLSEWNKAIVDKEQ